MINPLSPDKTRVVVAMSGGVDSSVAALLLHREGYDCLGVSMQVWDYRQHGGTMSRATCCAPDDFTDARRVAANIGLPYYVFDFERTFRTEVIDRFVDTYNRGLTPNPCIDCNNKVKFRELRERTAQMGCAYVATGHYARVVRNQGILKLLRGVDRDKDQSYFLYGITPQELAASLFPIGHLTKHEVREIARSAGLATADKPESQDICFISGSVQDFLVQMGGAQRKGKIIDRNGIILGEHNGISHFTVGQRRGTGIGGSQEPLYVIELDDENNLVVLGPRSDLEGNSFLVDEVNWLSPELSAGRQMEIDAIVQVRHRHRGVPAKLMISRTEVSVRVINELVVASPGQAAVFYDLNNEQVLGGGRIKTSNHGFSPI